MLRPKLCTPKILVIKLSMDWNHLQTMLAAMLFLVAKVSIFLRWASWLIRHVMKARDTVIINADETCISNLTSWTHGTFITRVRGKRIADAHVHDCRREPRITLLAAVCDDAILQPRLLQVCFPRLLGKEHPDDDTLDLYRRMRSPLEVWHDSRGWLRTQIFIKWLTHLRRTAHVHRPGAWVVLLIDCDPRHLALKVIQHCRQLGILLLSVPARLTGLLQPLDVQVFSCFKRDLSRRHQVTRLQSALGKLDDMAQWEHVDESVAQEVVHKDWTRTFARCGCGQTLAELSHNIGCLVEQVNLKARPPSAEELADLLGRKLTAGTKRLAEEILQLQMSLLTRPATERPPTWRFGMRYASMPDKDAAAESLPSAPSSHMAQKPTSVAAVRAVRLMLPSVSAEKMARRRTREGPSAGARSQKRR